MVTLEIRISLQQGLHYCLLRAQLTVYLLTFPNYFCRLLFVCGHWSLHSVISVVSQTEPKRKKKNTLPLFANWLWPRHSFNTQPDHLQLYFSFHSLFVHKWKIFQWYKPHILWSFLSMCLALGMYVTFQIPQYMWGPSKALIRWCHSERFLRRQNKDKTLCQSFRELWEVKKCNLWEPQLFEDTVHIVYPAPPPLHHPIHTHQQATPEPRLPSF